MRFVETRQVLEPVIGGTETIRAGSFLGWSGEEWVAVGPDGPPSELLLTQPGYVNQRSAACRQAVVHLGDEDTTPVGTPVRDPTDRIVGRVVSRYFAYIDLSGAPCGHQKTNKAVGRKL